MSMRDKFEFREPLSIEPDGTYITAGQMQFYLNRPKGEEKFKEGDAEFFEYYNVCRIYNVVSDIMDADEEAAIMYWDPQKNGISVAFPATGKVAKSLSTITPFGEDEMWDGTDPWED